MQTYRIYVGDIDTGCTVVESSPEDARAAWDALRDSSEWGWLYGPVTVEEEWRCWANGWIASDEPCDGSEGVVSRLALRLRGRRVA